MRIAVAIVASSLVASVALADSAPKIGYVNLQVALNESNKGQKAKQQFKKEVDKLQGELKGQKEDLESLKEQIEKKASVMKESERVELEDDYRRKLRDFERTYKDAQSDLQRKDNELTGAILQELQEVVAEYGEDNDYTLILEVSSGGVLYGAKGADITDTIIKAYNKKK